MDELEIQNQDDKLEERAVIKSQKIKQIAGSFWVLVIAGILLYFVNSPPKDFPVEQTLNIEAGLSAKEVTKALKYFGLIRSELWFSAMLIIFNDPNSIKAGSYTFTEPKTTYELAQYVTADAPPEELISLTFPEGFSAKDYAKIADAKLVDFDPEFFFSKAVAFEGYLFPETYKVPPGFSEEDLILLLRKTYTEKTTELNELIKTNGQKEAEVVTLASIVEREANTSESMKIVASILIKRLELGMPLQADATMEYVLEKPLNELNAEDLEVDTPYNTYKYKGLPPTPIGNPGLRALGAVLLPTTTDYLYYITDANGDFRYAKTYEEHKRNIEKYLR